MKTRLKSLSTTALIDPNALLEDELRIVAAHWSAEKRLEMSATLARWAEQLFESAAQMNPDLAKSHAAPVPKIPRGFFLINLSKSDEADLRSLAAELGYELRGIIKYGIAAEKWRLREKVKLVRLFGVNPFECERFIAGDKKN